MFHRETGQSLVGVNCPVCTTRHVPLKGQLTNGAYTCTCESCGHLFKFRAFHNFKSSATFTVNGKEFTVTTDDYPPATVLNTFLRKSGVSMGTKGCCYEGGCGTCLATITAYEPILKTKMNYTVNSCLFELYACDGMEITTIEGLGNPTQGLHPIQERLANHDGTQCGFCSPSQVLNMYGLLKANPKPTQQLIEDHFDVTICRCTGYRSILDAMKTFAVDAPAHLKKELIDIEELDAKMCKKTGQACTGTCHGRDQTTGKCENQTSGLPLYAVGANKVQWYTPTTLAMLLDLVNQYREDKYRLIFGNTAFGVYPEYHPKKYQVLIETRKIMDFYKIEVGDETVNLGANLTPQNLLDLFDKHRGNPKLPYAGPFCEHMKLIAQQGVRNVACWAGNLLLKNKDYKPGFASDLYLCFEIVKGKLVIYDGDGTRSVVTIPEFLKMDMKGKVIAELTLPTYSTQDIFIRTYKISLRLQSCRGYMNGAFNFRLDDKNNFYVKERPSIVMGGIATDFTHAEQTESYLTGKSLGDPKVIKEAFKVLSQELVPGPGVGSPEYRKSLALSLFYKYILDVCKVKVSPEYMSGATGLMRTPVVGTQDYGTKPSMWPVTKPMPKRDGQYLTSGLGRYLDDFPTPANMLAGVPVLSTIGQGTIDTIDPSAALAMPGVVAFLQASDIPAGGVNNWRPKSIFKGKVQELLSSGPVNYAGQAIGVIVAKTMGAGTKASAAVKVTYKDVKTPIVTIEDAIKRKSFHPNPPPPKSVGDAKGAIAAARYKLTGSIACGDQYHFHLETQAVSCIKSDNGGMDVMATSQCIDGVQETVAQVLGLPESQVTVESKRVGGAYGGKIAQTFMVAGMTALAVNVLDAPVKMRLSLPNNMKMCGKRAAYRLDYTLGLDENGKMLGIDVKVFADSGCEMIKFDGQWIFNWIDNAYFCPNWLVTFVPLRTNKAGPASCRGPGSTPAVFFMESIMDHVARYLSKDELSVRLQNLYTNGQSTPRGMILEYCTIRRVMAQHIIDVDYAKRKAQVNAFNKANRWKKRGISLMPNMFGIQWKGKQLNTHVIIHHGDGSVSVAHGGIDIGQGINMKVIQVCAYELGISMEKIQVKKSSTTINANSSTTGGSSTSELSCLGVIEACKILKKRMAPVKAQMGDPTWEELVTKCYEEMVDLTAGYTTHENDPTKFHYNCYSAATVEAEIDVLTGQYQLRQMDMLYDCGDSMNPELDIGQAEGAFVMGLGYFLLEELMYDKKTGQITNASTWSYKPPLAKDLPMKFNFKFQRNMPNPIGVLGSKAVAEPALVMSAAAILAIKHAIEAARADNGHTEFFPLDAPATPEKVQTLCMNNVANYTLQK